MIGTRNHLSKLIRLNPWALVAKSKKVTQLQLLAFFLLFLFLRALTFAIVQPDVGVNESGHFLDRLPSTTLEMIRGSR